MDTLPCTDEVSALVALVTGGDVVWPLALFALDGLGSTRSVPTGDVLSALLARRDVPGDVLPAAVRSLSRHALLGSGYVSDALLGALLSDVRVPASLRVEVLARCWESHPMASGEYDPSSRESYRERLSALSSGCGAPEVLVAAGLVRRYSVSPMDPSRVGELAVGLSLLAPEVLEVVWTLLDDHLSDPWERWKDPFPGLVERALLLL